MAFPVWILITLLVIPVVIAAVLHIWFHATGAASIIVIACVILAAVFWRRLKDARPSMTGVMTIVVPPSRIWSMAAVALIGLVIIAVLISQ